MKIECGGEGARPIDSAEVAALGGTRLRAAVTPQQRQASLTLGIGDLEIATPPTTS